MRAGPVFVGTPSIPLVARDPRTCHGLVNPGAPQAGTRRHSPTRAPQRRELPTVTRTLTGRASHHGVKNIDVKARGYGHSRRGCRMMCPLLAEEGHEFFSFPRFNEPALKVGLHLRVRSVTTLPHGDRYTRHMPHKLRDVATAHRLTRIKASPVRVFHVKQLLARGRSPIEELTARTRSIPFDWKPCMTLNDAFLSLTGDFVHILDHSFTCIRCARRAHQSMFDKVRHQTHTTNAHLRRPSLNFGKMCIIVTSYF